MPKREHIEDLHAKLKVLPLGDRECLRQSDVTTHVIRLPNTVTACVSIHITSGNRVGCGIDPMENVALEIRLRVLCWVQNSKNRSIRITDLVWTTQVSPYTVLAITAEAGRQRLGQTGSNCVDSAEVPSTNDPIGRSKRNWTTFAYGQLVRTTGDETTRLVKA